MFKIGIYDCDVLINIVSVGHPCLIDFIKKVHNKYRIVIYGYNECLKGSEIL